MRTYFLLALLPLALISCGNKTDNDAATQDSLTYVPKVTHGPIADEARDFDYDVKHNGANYQIHIHREACDSLKTITDDFGDVFADYSISVQVRREGSNILNRAFTKNDFASYVDKAEFGHCILEGIAFDKADKDGLNFGISISRPDSEGGTRLTMTIDAAGGMTISKAQTQDVANIEEVQD